MALSAVVVRKCVFFIISTLLGYSQEGENKSYHSVFVYGTLKRGEPNHKVFKDDFSQGYWKFIGEGRTTEKYPLIIGTKYNIPFLLYSAGNGTHVKGEIYQVDDKMLEFLDKFEEHPDFYERDVKKIQCSSDNTTTQVVDCWIYFLKKFRPELLSKPYYSNYSSAGEHGLVYIERYLRDPLIPGKTDVYLDS